MGIPHHRLRLLTPGLQVVALFGKVVELLRGRVLLKKVSHRGELWEFIASPHFQFILTASCVWLKM